MVEAQKLDSPTGERADEEEGAQVVIISLRSSDKSFAKRLVGTQADNTEKAKGRLVALAERLISITAKEGEVFIRCVRSDMKVALEGAYA